MTPPSASSQSTATPRPVRAAGTPIRSRAPMPPRRVSGPVSRPHGRPLTRPHTGREETLAVRAASGAIAFLRSLPDHRWLDRLVRGRAWIPVLGVLLAGIVATQVEVLKLGASTGRWVARTAALSSRNQTLQASVAALSDDQRIERLASGMGMVMPAPWAVSFLPLTPRGGVQAALGGIHSPSSSQFLASLAATQATALSAAPAAPPPAPTGSVSTATTSGSVASPGSVAPAAVTQPSAGPAPPASSTAPPTGPTAQTGTPAAGATTTPAPAATTGAPSGGAVAPSGGTSQQTTGG